MQISESCSTAPSYMVQRKRKALFQLKKLAIMLAIWKSESRTIQLGNARKTLLGWRKLAVQRAVISFFTKTELYDRKKLMALLSGNRRIFVFPLHYHPEASTSTDANFLPRDVELAIVIANALSATDTLVVKTHPSHSAGLSVADRNLLRSHPNIKLVDQYSGGHILEFATALITINSTMMFESFDLGVPVGTFGRTPLDQFSGEMQPTRLTLDDSLKQQIEDLQRQAPRNQGNLARSLYRRLVYYKSPRDLTPQDLRKIAQLINKP